MVTVKEKDLVLFLHPRIEVKALYMQSKYCPTESHSQATCFNISKYGCILEVLPTTPVGGWNLASDSMEKWEPNYQDQKKVREDLQVFPWTKLSLRPPWNTCNSVKTSKQDTQLENGQSI